MLAHSINRGVNKHALPRTQLPSVLSRSVSHWGRRRWPRWRDDAVNEEWKRFQHKMDAFHKQIETDPYETLFGRSNELLRGIGIFRSPPEAEVPRKTVPSPTDNQQQDAVECSYDPISGRMVPRNGASTSSADVHPSIHYTQNHHDPRDDALKAFDQKQNSTPTESSDWLVQETFAQNFRPASSENSEHDQLHDSLAKYDQRIQDQPQKPPAPQSEWLVQEDHARSSPRRPKLPENDIDLLTASDVRARMGIRKHPAEHPSRKSAGEKRMKSMHEVEGTIDQATSEIAREARMIHAKRERLKAAHARAEHARKASEESGAASIRHDDGYSHTPTGLQTSFEREKASGCDLATDIQARTNPEQYDDGYSREPTGLQTSFAKEQASGRSLAEDIKSRTDPKSYLVDDGYSREPMGLETSFEREKASGHSLADEIQASTDPKARIFEDGYSRVPTGLETSYQREVESGWSLEEDIQARDNARLTPLDDGYSREPTGLQSSYAREVAAVTNGEKKSLEAELGEMSIGAASYSDVCPLEAPESSMSSGAANPATAPPRSVQQRRRQGAAPDEVKDWYGYSLKPLGLQTSYQREIEACQKGQRKSLEEELQEKALRAAFGDSGHDDLGYSLKPTGLETSFQREVEACVNGKRKSLEDELAVPVDGGAVETMSTREEAAKLQLAREQRLHDIALVREVREIYEKYYGKITTTHRQAKEVSTTPESVASLSAGNEGRVDDQVHQSLSAYDSKNPGTYNFTPDNLEAELGAQNHSPLPSKPFTKQEPAPSTTSGADLDHTAAEFFKSEETNAAAPSAKPRVYKLLAFDRTTKSLTTSQTSSVVNSPGEHPIPLGVALSNLTDPAKFLPQLASLQREGYEPVASTSNLLVLRLRDDKNTKDASRRTPRPNPIDGTTIPLPPTPTMSPTGYINLDPVMEKPAVNKKLSPRNKDDKKVRRTEPVFSGERSRREGPKGQSVRTVLTTLIWATAACYVAGVAGEVAKGY